MVRRSALPNGIRVVTETLEGVPSATIGIWVESGSRFEPLHLGGISHFLEHLLFKGTERRSAAQIAEEIDAVGGVLNAFTGKEYTCYYARVLAEHAPLATELLEDLFLRSRLAPEEIDRERAVVLQEISQSEDTPDDLIHDLFNEHYWPTHPLGRPVCGRSATVEAFARPQFVDFLAERYRPNRVIIAAAGAIDHDVVEAWAARAFADLRGAAPLVDGGPPAPHAGVAVTEKPLEQVHLCLGVPGVAQGADERYAAYLLNTILGGGMSSRLFQEIRERRGRAYSVYSFLSCYRDSGYLGIYVGTSADWVEEVVAAITREMDTLAREGVRPDELARAKTQLKGNLLLGLETSDSRMSRIAKNEIYYGRDVPITELSAGIDRVTRDDLASLAACLARPEERALALLGDLGGRSISSDLLAV